MSLRQVRLVFTGELWRHDGEGGWHFITLPPEVAEELRSVSAPPAGFGSLKVVATVGQRTWLTSVFPDKKSGSFVLPVSKPVRRAEGLEDGDVVEVTISPALQQF